MYILILTCEEIFFLETGEKFIKTVFKWKKKVTTKKRTEVRGWTFWAHSLSKIGLD